MLAALLVLLALCAPDAGASALRATAATPKAPEPGNARPVAHAMLPGMAHTDAGSRPDDLRAWAFRGRQRGPLALGGELLPGVHALIGMCTEVEVQALHAASDAPSQRVLKELLETYATQGKYLGKI